MSRYLPAKASVRPHLNLLTQIAHEARVLSATRYEHVDLGRRRLPVLRAGEESSRALNDSLAELIYARYYLNDPRAINALRTATTDQTLIATREDPDLGRRLREANAGAGYFDPGWTVVETPADAEGTYLVHKGRLSLSVRPDQIAHDGKQPLATGSSVAVRFPKHRPAAMTGFYAAIGSAGPPRSEGALVRWYVHLLPEGAPRLVELLTRGLNERSVPFLLKVLNHPDAYTRPDAAVLYLSRPTFERTCSVVLEAYRAVAHAVRPRVPAFTRCVRPGLGLAEEPPQTEGRVSFGQHRSRLVARGLVDAAVSGRNTVTGRLDAILAVLAAERIAIDAPHLNPGSDEFAIPGEPKEGPSW